VLFNSIAVQISCRCVEEIIGHNLMKVMSAEVLTLIPSAVSEENKKLVTRMCV